MRAGVLALLVASSAVFAQEVSPPALRKLDLLGKEEAAGAPERQLKSSGNSFLDSLKGLVVGLVLLPFSFALIMVNEQNRARMENLHSYAKREVEETESDQLDDDLDWKLVHTTGETSTRQTLEDPVFVKNGSVQPTPRVTNSVKLKREMEVYQHVEHEDDDDDDDNNKTWIKQEWVSYYVDSSEFQSKHQQFVNPPPPSFLAPKLSFLSKVDSKEKASLTFPGAFHETWYATDVRLGVYDLHQELLEKLNFEPLQDEWSYLDAQLGYGKPSNPQIGDIRVKYSTCPCGPTTVVALQTDEASFLPYRIIPRCCLCSEEAKKEMLKDYAQMTIEEYDATLDCPVPLLCYLCNLASRFIYMAQRPSVFYIAKGEEEPEEAFQNMESSAGVTACVLRLVAWVLMWVSILLIAGPFVKLVSFIPFIGHFFASLLAISVLLVACCGTALISGIVMFTFYVLVRPLIAIPLATLVIGGIVAFNYFYNGPDGIVAEKML